MWLNPDITSDSARDLYDYLRHQLDVAEIVPAGIIRRLNRKFLVTQPDEWILRLYGFLNQRPALHHLLSDLPLIRLENGVHVVPEADGKRLAFIPTATKTDFPTVRGSVCATKAARTFLRSLGLEEPDPVDDVIENVLPTYRENEIDISDTQYETDIRRIQTAFGTDSETRRKRLIDELKKSHFVKAVDAGDHTEGYAKPGEVYLATERLKSLFEGISGILFLDDSYPCLRGEDIRELLERCDALRYLRPVGDNTFFYEYEELRKLRVKAGHPETSGQNDRVIDRTLKGLEELINILPNFDVGRQKNVANLLWRELAHLEDRRGKNLFQANYSWTHYGSYSQLFDAAFVRILNDTRWVPDVDGKLQFPKVILFDSLGWEGHPFLESMIRFKPPIIQTLAQEAGFEPEMLDLLSKLGITSEAELRDRIGLESESIEDESGTVDKISNSVDSESGESGWNSLDRAGAESDRRMSSVSHGEKNIEDPKSSNWTGHSEGREEGLDVVQQKPNSETPSSYSFISYVAVHYGEEPDPEGLDHESRMKLEAEAINLIVVAEPDWRRTPSNNPGYDLYEVNQDDRPIRWCEVKAMSSSLQDRPVGLSTTQFDCARNHAENYWLYVVEHAGTDGARIVRIQDPAGKARTFTFDRGWLNVAIVGTESDGGEI